MCTFPGNGFRLSLTSSERHYGAGRTRWNDLQNTDYFGGYRNT